MSGKIIALAGPSGVGKNFVKQALKTQFPQLSELTVFTTRAGRLSDGADRKTDISVNDFLEMQKENKIIVAHQPFGSEGDWYGFSKEQIDEFIKNKKQILTEIHVDNVVLLKKLYGDKIYLLAITAENEYLEYNLQLRNSEKGMDKVIRLESAAKEIKVIEEMWKKNLINKIINVNWDNRNKLAELAINEVGQEVKLPTERENKLKLK